MNKGAVILLGPSCCGKSVLAQSILNELNFESPRIHLSMGAKLRRINYNLKNQKSNINEIDLTCIDFEANILESEELNKKEIDLIQKMLPELSDFANIDTNEKYISNGQWLDFCLFKGILVPAFWSNLILKQALSSDVNKPQLLILDGYPCSLEETKKMLSYFKEIQFPIIKTVHIHISKYEMYKRAKERNRQDYSVETLNVRYQTYIDEILPSLDFIKTNLGNEFVSIIDGHQPIKNSLEEISTNDSIEKVIIDFKSLFEK